MGIDRQCRWVRYRLPLLIGGELKVEERRRVERHLIGCSDCQGQRSRSTDAFAALRSFAEVSAPVLVDSPSVWPALAGQIRESRHASPSLSWWETPLPRNWAALSLAMGLIGLVAGPLALLSGRDPVRTAPTSVTTRPVEPPRLAATPPSALPSDRSRPVDGSSKGGANSGFDPTAGPGLQVNYDLDHGTPIGSGSRDPQHSY